MIHEVQSIEHERAIVICVLQKGSDRTIATEHLDELEFLAETANVDVCARLIQERAKPDGATYIGKGKVEELKELLEGENAKVVIVDDDLTPAQARNLERQLEVKVIDRSALILDIFANRARTLEAKTQVELAQYQYLLPRLTRMWTHLSKQYGGVGTKGPGETQIETDRRIVRYRIQRLKEKLNEIDVQKVTQRKQRQSMARFALVGYTNAGKSTLMNLITDATVYVENQLFATLDTTVRQFNLPSGQTCLLSDTVGFIRKLPPHLVASFRSTLAESIESDMLLHIVDVSNPSFREHISVVMETLEHLNIHNKPLLLVLNKTDLIEDKDVLRNIEFEFPGSISISAQQGLNVRTLLQKLQEFHDSLGTTLTLEFPYSSMAMVGKVYSLAEVIERTDNDDGVSMTIRITSDKLPAFRNLYETYIRSSDADSTNDTLMTPSSTESVS